MSASTEKKLRAQARAEGTDKKTVAAQKEAEKRKKVNTWKILALIFIILAAAVIIFVNTDIRYHATTALTVGDRNYSPAEVNYQFGSEYQEFLSNYGDYASLFGLDTSTGMVGLASQECMYTDGGTWRDYFKDNAITALKQTQAMLKYAAENGIELTDDEKAEIETQLGSYDTYAASNGYNDVDRFIAAVYGRGVNKDIVRTMLNDAYLASKAYTDHSGKIEVTDAQVKEEYPSVAVRHILVKAEANEDGEYTEEALAAAKTKAEEILAEYEDGDKTEESFAALAEKYSEDEGSNTNGGLYSNIHSGDTVEEFDAFCFDPARKTGDTGIVFGDNGSYQGYHVMYFVGEGDPSTDDTGRSRIRSEILSAWVEDITTGVEVVEQKAMKLVGKG